MRTLVSRLFVLGALLVLPVTAAACSSKAEPKGELMLSIQTDMSIPKDVDLVRIEVKRYGVLLFGRDFPVGPDGVHIPATLAIVAGKEVAPVIIRIIARHGGKLRVLREATTTVPTDRVALLRMPIQWLCDGQAKEPEPGQVESTCPEGQTCVAGTCQDQAVDSATLPPYSPGEVFGGGTGAGDGVCLDTVTCFAKGAAAVVDLSSCSIAMPENSTAGINIALVRPPNTEGICGPDACLIPLDANSDAGWREQGSHIVLPAVVCKRLQDGMVTAVAVTTACPTKTESVPTCGPWSSVSDPGATFDAGAPQGIDFDAAPEVSVETGPEPQPEAGKDALADSAAESGQDSQADVDAGPTCTNGQTDCVGNTPRLCESGGWTNLAPCGGQLPLCSGGTCVCQDASVMCQGNTPAVCVAGAWSGGNPCAGDAPLCVNGACVCLEGAKDCWSSNELRTCVNGFWSTSTCLVPTPACVLGSCVSCVDGQLDCIGATPQLCAGNVWTPQTACSGATPACQAGQCVECKDGYGDCVGTSPRTCVAGSWSALPDCSGATPVCDVGTCVAQSARTIGVGRGISCAVLADGTVSCWGWTGNQPQPTPTPALGITNAVEVAVGDYDVCARRSDGSVWCWQTQSTPMPMPTLSNVVEIAAGSRHMCARLGDGTVWCWGENLQGQLGDSTTTAAYDPVQAVGVSSAAQLASGMEHSCARKTDGTVLCWGDNAYYQAGIDNGGQDLLVPTPVAGVEQAGDLSAGGHSTCLRTTDGSLACLGSAGSTLAPGFSNVQQVAVGWNQTCARLVNGTVACQGTNSAGELGDGTVVNATTPVLVSSITDAVEIELGGGDIDSQGMQSPGRGCARLSTGAVACWGDNSFAQLGVASAAINPDSVMATQPKTVSKLVSGGANTCALNADATVTCWGTDRDSAFGDNGVDDKPVPSVMAGLSNVVELDLSSSNNAAGVRGCARLQNGSVSCWGRDFGANPTQIPGLQNTLGVAVGYDHACVIAADNTVLCWGGNQWGEVGDGTNDKRTAPTPVVNLTSVVGITAGLSHMCAWKSDHTVWCWGINYQGMLGDGTTAHKNVPVQAVGVTGATAVSSAWGHTCALLQDSTVMCWGFNQAGQAQPDGGGGNVVLPATVANLANVAQVVAGVGTTCARLLSGTVTCWGYDAFGANGTLDTQPGLKPVAGLSEVKDLTVGGIGYSVWTMGHACALSQSGPPVVCWGSDYYGQLGDGRLGYSPVPVTIPGLSVF
jgi:alpha-tubulin suppressor-like RCC1 family protein